MYRKLDPASINDTARRLASRVEERFPGRGLAGVAREVAEVCERGGRDAEWFGRPHWPIRLGVVAAALAFAVLLAAAIRTVRFRQELPALPDLVQAVEAIVNDFIFVGIALYFLASLETRRKRRRALKALHELRSMAHIIDMHQLTKDPEWMRQPTTNTPSSPERPMTPFELSRYLDYSSELLSMLSKTAALYVQNFADPVTVSAVNEVENLTSGLSRKIWQKIMILDRSLPAEDGKTVRR
ncbi:MAG: hypothetical protein ABI647_00545 [Gemmatimonadota bacterium]